MEFHAAFLEIKLFWWRDPEPKRGGDLQAPRSILFPRQNLRRVRKKMCDTAQGCTDPLDVLDLINAS
jgi:hypothetical protein